ncbi:MAG: transketolase [Faecalibacterium sp.]
MNREREIALENMCHDFRIFLITLLHEIQTGHPGGSLSVTEIVTTLYQEIMQIDSENPHSDTRDRLVLSKGHAVPMLYLNMAERGVFPKEELHTLRQQGSRLQGHPCKHKLPGIDVSTGPLGLGLSVGIGIASSCQLKEQDYYTYVILGDGEIQEGCIWEAAMSAAKFRPKNLIAILDHNGVQLDGTNAEIMPLFDIQKKFEAFGWHVLTCDGHNIGAFYSAVEQAKMIEDKPVIILCETVKGKGVSFMEGQSTWHGKPINDAEYAAAMKELVGERDE